MTEIKKTNFSLYTSITMRNTVVKDVLCFLHLPLKVTDEVKLYFQPTENQLEILKFPTVFYWKFSVKGEIKDNNGKIESIIESNNVYSDKIDAHKEFPLIGVSTDLKITKFLDSEISNNIVGKFWTTSNSLLQPALSGNPEIEANIARQFEFSPNDKLNFKFGINPANYNQSEIETFSELIADFELKDEKIDSQKIQETLEIFDDILLLTSFASRSKCVCLKWEYSDSKTQITKYIKDKSIPDYSHIKGSNKNEELIGLTNFFEGFLSKTFPNFREYSRVEALRRSLHFIIPNKSETLESQFISLFTALEMIVLHYRKNNGLEEVLSSKAFAEFRDGLGKYIKNLDLTVFLEDEIKELKSNLTNENEINEKIKKLVKEKRKLIKQKLGELNRVSFSEALIEFCNYFDGKLALSDLWAIKGKNNGLAEIRNKLVHGEHFTEKQITALWYASEHLRWTVERMILAILDWSIDKSNISQKYLNRNSHPYLEWEDKRNEFST